MYFQAAVDTRRVFRDQLRTLVGKLINTTIALRRFDIIIIAISAVAIKILRVVQCKPAEALIMSTDARG